MQPITLDEATAGERRIRFSMNSATDGSDVTGEAANITVKVRHPGTEDFVAATGTVTEGDATDAPGDYYYEAAAGEVDTAGIGAIRPTLAGALTFTYPFIITPNDVLTAAPSVADIATGVRSELTTELGRIDAAITTRADAATQTAIDAAVSALNDFDPATETVTLADGTHGGASATITAAITGNVTGNLVGNVTGSVGSVAGAVASVTAPVTLADGPHGGASTLITGTFVGSVSGSVGSVTGNVVGSVGSVTGAVGSVTGAVGSVTGLTASDVAAIKAKTDSLTFTKAAELDVNVQSINGATVTGDGNATPWDGA
jgi:hypothetical protein